MFYFQDRFCWAHLFVQILSVCLVQREPLNDNKVGKLLDRLPHCGPDAFDNFALALRDTGHGHAADIITEPESVDNQPPVMPHDSRTPDGIPFHKHFNVGCSN